MDICIIPARLGSKRIKEKNIIKFFGKPLISYVIKEAKKSEIFDEIIVSTDSNKIKNICKKYGANIYFNRPKRLSSDKTTTMEIIKHAVKYLNSKGKKIQNICCIYPTAVLLKAKHLKRSFKILKKKNSGFIFSVSRFEHPIERAIFKKNKNLQILKKKFIHKQSNLIKDHYYDAGQFYWGKSSDWLKNDMIFTKNSEIYCLSRFEAIDINYKDDLNLAKILFKKN